MGLSGCAAHLGKGQMQLKAWTGPQDAPGLSGGKGAAESGPSPASDGDSLCAGQDGHFWGGRRDPPKSRAAPLCDLRSHPNAHTLPELSLSLFFSFFFAPRELFALAQGEQQTGLGTTSSVQPHAILQTRPPEALAGSRPIPGRPSPVPPSCERPRGGRRGGGTAAPAVPAAPAAPAAPQVPKSLVARTSAFLVRDWSRKGEFSHHRRPVASVTFGEGRVI